MSTQVDLQASGEERTDHPDAERMSALAESFPSIARKAGVRPWNPELLAAQLGVLSHGEAAAARFVLQFWGGGNYPEIGPFDLVDAMTVWDARHIDALTVFISRWRVRRWWP